MEDGGPSPKHGFGDEQETCVQCPADNDSANNSQHATRHQSIVRSVAEALYPTTLYQRAFYYSPFLRPLSLGFQIREFLDHTLFSNEVSVVQRRDTLLANPKGSRKVSSGR